MLDFCCGYTALCIIIEGTKEREMQKKNGRHNFLEYFVRKFMIDISFMVQSFLRFYSIFNLCLHLVLIVLTYRKNQTGTTSVFKTGLAEVEQALILVQFCTKRGNSNQTILVQTGAKTQIKLVQTGEPESTG